MGFCVRRILAVVAAAAADPHSCWWSWGWSAAAAAVSQQGLVELKQGLELSKNWSCLSMDGNVNAVQVHV